MENLRGALFMTLAMAAFAAEDAFIKGLAEAWPSGQIVLALGLGGTVIFAAICRIQGHAPLPRAALSAPMFVRSGFEAVGTFAFVTALALIPLALASAILQATPLLVTWGAAVFLGQAVGWRRLTAILAGLAGVLIILRPGTDGFEPAALLAVLATLCLAGRDIAIRRVSARVTGPQIAFFSFLSLIPTGALILAFDPAPLGALTPSALLAFGGAMLLGTLAYSLIVEATRIGEVAVTTPFRYTRLIFAMALGLAFFGERPDATTLIGAAIVIASGLYTLWREARLARLV
ncbi:MAG: DMT family transporter [Pseudomonadota bacterium]